MNFVAPHIDYSGLGPVIALTAGVCVVLLVGLIGGPRSRWTVSAVSLITLAVAAARCIIEWNSSQDLVAGALRLDDLGLAVALIAIAAAAFVVPLTLREPAAEEAGHGEFQALILASTLGMVMLAQSQNLITLFVSLELLSVPLYILCGSALRRRESLEAGLKYLIVGSLGSATLLYGLAFIYGGSKATGFVAIRNAVGGSLADDPLILVGIGLAATGLAFKASLAPFHQWTPDVYQGAPTPVTAFMSVATKAAAFAVFARFFLVALGGSISDWEDPLAVIAVVSIAVGNIGALGQSSVKRLLGYSGIAQAGYMLTGLLVGTQFGLQALVFYLAAYALMNLPVFAAVAIRERETPYGDDIRAVAGIGRDRPALAWPMTIGLLALAGLPGTTGFIGKLDLIEAAAEDGKTWLGVAIVVGAMISLAYYLRVVAAVWMRPESESAGQAGQAFAAIAGGSPEADTEAPQAQTAPSGGRCPFVLTPMALAAAATVFFGIIPSPLVDWATNAGHALGAYLP